MGAAVPTISLLRFFDAAHLRRFGVKAIIMPGKDAALLARLYRSHGEDVLKRMIEAFFESSDPYVLRAGFSVGVFVSQTPKLVLRAARPEPVEIGAWTDECQVLHGGRCTNAWFHAALKGA